MAGSGDSSSGSGLRAGSLVIRRFGDTYQFELDLPSAGGGSAPAIWSGAQRVDEDTWSTLREALDTTATSSRAGQALDPIGTATQVLLKPPRSLEWLGGLIHRSVLPDEVKEELSRYDGPLVLATDDPSLPWELLHDGQDFLGLRHAVGRRLVITRRRRAARHGEAVGGALVIGNPGGDSVEADREIDAVVELLASLTTCTVLRGACASKQDVLDAMNGTSFGLYNIVWDVSVYPYDDVSVL